ncbi:MAG: type IV toxin-antitoxin system AbiEi family antitoxin [Myxococcota bacterium]
MDTPRPEWVDRAIGALPAGLEAEIRDGMVQIHRNHTVHAYAMLPKRAVRPSTIAAVADAARAQVGPTLLVSEYVSPECAELLRARGLAFADAAGNVFLDAPEYLVLVTGRRSPTPVVDPSERLAAAALQVAFVLLRDPDAASLGVRALGATAGVSHGAAANALRTFARRGWVDGDGAITDAHGLAAAWVAGFADRLGPKLVLARAACPGAPSVEAWARSVVDRVSPDLLGGEAAAMVADLPLRGPTGSVYVRAWDAATMKRLRLAPSADGPITVRSAFAPSLGDPVDPRLADPLLVLAELSALPDERLDETRAALRERVSARFAP